MNLQNLVISRESFGFHRIPNTSCRLKKTVEVLINNNVPYTFLIDNSFLSRTGDVLDLSEYLLDYDSYEPSLNLLTCRAGQLKALLRAHQNLPGSVITSPSVFTEFKIDRILKNRWEQASSLFLASQRHKEIFNEVSRLHGELYKILKQNQIIGRGKLVFDFIEQNELRKLPNGKTLSNSDRNLGALGMMLANNPLCKKEVFIVTEDQDFLYFIPPEEYFLNPDSNIKMPRLLFPSRVLYSELDKGMATRRFNICFFGLPNGTKAPNRGNYILVSPDGSNVCSRRR